MKGMEKHGKESSRYRYRYRYGEERKGNVGQAMER
jgi:hypothetical protein